MIGELADDDRREQRRPRRASRQHLHRSGGRRDGVLAAGAGDFLQAVLVLDEMAGDVLEPAGRVASDAGPRLSAARTDALVGGHRDLVTLARDLAPDDCPAFSLRPALPLRRTLRLDLAAERLVLAGQGVRIDFGTLALALFDRLFEKKQELRRIDPFRLSRSEERRVGKECRL